MNPTDFTELFPEEIVINIFSHLNITTFKVFLHYYWISPSWRRVLMHCIFPKISHRVTQNPPFSNFVLQRFKALEHEKTLLTFSAQRVKLGSPVVYSFSFLFMMYHVADIDMGIIGRTYDASFFCSTETIFNIILICGSNCLETIRINSRLVKKDFQTMLCHLYNSSTLQTIIIEGVLDVGAFDVGAVRGVSVDTPNTTLREEVKFTACGVV
ncbi:hypothetical protein BDC45DRAFT_571540 [Circinella umbellata]|nr:hypothetical protein BDC45DRAFT_571540 [Circinella umbellata]